MLKKISYIIITASVVLSGTLFAQRIKWEEKFEDNLILNRGWSLINNDNGAADIELYKPFDFIGIGNQSAETGTYFFRLGFESANRFNLIDDWIVTPQLFSIHEGERTKLEKIKWEGLSSSNLSARCGSFAFL